MSSPYWQHVDPLECPKGHKMIWLGRVFWICDKKKCNQIYVEEPPYEQQRKHIERYQNRQSANAEAGQSHL